jgi:hypothetical protein
MFEVLGLEEAVRTMSYKNAILRSLSPIMGKVIAIPAISKVVAVSALICSRCYGIFKVDDILLVGLVLMRLREMNNKHVIQ